MNITDTPESISTDGGNTTTNGGTHIPYMNLPEYKAAMMVRIIALCIIIPLATVGNILSVIVLGRKKLRQSTTSLYLICLSVVDLAVVYLVCLPESISKLTGEFLENTSDAMCKLSFFNSHFTRQLSSWVLVLVSVERVIAVYYPTKVKKCCSRKMGGIALIVTTVCLALISGRLFFTRHLNAIGQCRAPEHLVYFAVKISSWIVKVLYWAGPASIMVLTNSLIFVKLRIIAKRGTARSANKLYNNTITIVVATTTFITTTTPLPLFFIFNPGWNIQPADVKVTYELPYAFLQSWAYLNHAVNFLLYVASAPRFRKELILILTRRSAVSPLDKRPSVGSSAGGMSRQTVLSRTPEIMILPKPSVVRRVTLEPATGSSFQVNNHPFDSVV